MVVTQRKLTSLDLYKLIILKEKYNVKFYYILYDLYIYSFEKKNEWVYLYQKNIFNRWVF